MLPLYTNESLGDTEGCFASGSTPDGHVREQRDLCLAAVRNSPHTLNAPQFVAFPLTTAHVQAAVRFAARHGLCIAVAGTGRTTAAMGTSLIICCCAAG